MLYRPEAFEPLTDEPWDEPHVRKRIQEIVDRTDAAFDAEMLWPAHDDDLWNSVAPVKNIYSGAAGVILGLETLRQRGHADVRTDLVRAIERTRELWAAESDLARIERLPEPRESSLVAGETGVLLTDFLLTRDASVADRLFARVRENGTNQANELMWGIPGTLLAAQAMSRLTDDQRWRDAAQESARELRARRDDDGLWTQHFGSGSARTLGPIHGAVGNAYVLLDEGDDVSALVRTLSDEAVIEDGCANWPPAAGNDLVRNDQIRLQWCHGAPGIVTAATSYLPVDLVVAGAETVWRAGAHRDKGAGLCHGTAGNGHALLATFERTGDEVWLERARRFAVHALAQVERTGPRHALFTGDLGVALFASNCIDARGRFPILDGFRFV